jgi:hypothetical protein
VTERDPSVAHPQIAPTHAQDTRHRPSKLAVPQGERTEIERRDPNKRTRNSQTHIAVDCFEGRIDDESDDTLTGDVGDMRELQRFLKVSVCESESGCCCRALGGAERS